MQVGAILLLCLVLQLSFSLANERKVKTKRSKVLQQNLKKYLKGNTHKVTIRSEITHGKHNHVQKKDSTFHSHINLPKIKTKIARPHNSSHGATKGEKRGKNAKPNTENIHNIAVKIISTTSNKKTFSKSNKSAKKKTERKRSVDLHVQKRSNANILSEDFSDVLEKEKRIDISEDKLPGGYGEEATSEDEDDDGSGSGDDDDDEESGSGSSDKEESEKGDSEKSVERDEDDVTQIVKNEAAGNKYTGYTQQATSFNNKEVKSDKPTLQGQGSKRQPKGEWICRKTCAPPMTFEECANPRCSYKIGTIKDLCYFLCQHQQPTCKETCKYE